MKAFWFRLQILLMMVRRSLLLHRVSSLITIGSVGLGVGLIFAVFSLSSQARDAFTGGNLGFDAILGSRGSKVQLVLNTVFHLERSPGNLRYELYREVKEDPQVEWAVPYMVGDNYQGFRIVGTTEEIFTEFEYQRGEKLKLQGSQSRPFDSLRAEAVIGVTVARETGLRIGDEFKAYHGLDYTEGVDPHDDVFTVVGILAPTSSALDRVLFVPLEGVYRLDGHVYFGSGEQFQPSDDEVIPDEHKEVSAVLIKFKGGIRVASNYVQKVNRQGKEATLVWPVATVMLELFDKLGWIHLVLELVAYLVVVVAIGSIVASLYNTMRERRREFAILRGLGARRSTVLTSIVLESLAISLLGCLIGAAIYVGLSWIAVEIVRERTGMVFGTWVAHDVFWLAPLAVSGLGTLAGLLPGLRAYSVDVATGLRNS